MGSDLVAVVIETREGAEYLFPDMPRSMLETIISQNVLSTGHLILVNISGSTLSMPARIVKTVSYDGEVKLHGPALHEL